MEAVLPAQWMWSPLQTDAQGVPTSSKLSVGDAGIYDDIGHLPLLRRRVKKLLVFDSAAIHNNRTDADHAGGTEHADAHEMVYLFAAFGQPNNLTDGLNPPGSPNPNGPAGQMTVFDPKEWPPLWERIRTLAAAREPIVVRGNFTVMDNARMGIVGCPTDCWQAEVVFALQMPIDGFVHALPPATAARLPHWFPNYHASELKSRFELSMISQYASWMTEQAVLREVRAMLGDGEPHA